jgi:tetratricopeptide (TPR) repeat protein
VISRLAQLYGCRYADLIGDVVDNGLLDFATAGGPGPVAPLARHAEAPERNGASRDVIPDAAAVGVQATDPRRVESDAASQKPALSPAASGVVFDEDPGEGTVSPEVHRRDILQLLAMPFGGAFTGTGLASLLSMFEMPMTVDESVVADIEEIVRRCQRLEASVGPHSVLSTLATQKKVVDRLVVAAPPGALQSRLLGLAGEIGGGLGWALFGLGAFQDARACYVTAREDAHRAGDPIRSAFILHDHSYLESWAGRHGAAADLALAAEVWAARSASPLTQAYAADVAAYAYAAGGHVHDAERAIGRAFDLVRRPTADDPAASRLSWLMGRLHGTEAQVALARGANDEAIAAVDNALSGISDYARRGAGLTVAFKVEALAARGDADAAAAELGTAIDLIATNPAPRAVARLRDLRQTVSAAGDTSLLREADDRAAAHGIALAA